MEQAVEGKDTDLGSERVPRRTRLTSRNAGRDHDVSQMAVRAGGKREYIGRAIDAPELTVEGSHLRVAHHGDGNLAPRRAGRDIHEPATEAVGALDASATVGDRNAQPERAWRGLVWTRVGVGAGHLASGEAAAASRSVGASSSYALTITCTSLCRTTSRSVK